MDIWKYMKKAAPPPPAPESVEVLEDGQLRMKWPDGEVTVHSARELRLSCPCAACLDEMTRVRTLDPETVPSDLVVRAAEPVGNYAIRLIFSDEHATGLYTWSHFRQG